MHIPSGASQTIEILSFDDALAASGRRGDYDSEKWLYVPDFYTEYRYILGTKGQNPLICIGINPSTAGRSGQHAQVRRENSGGQRL